MKSQIPWLRVFVEGVVIVGLAARLTVQRWRAVLEAAKTGRRVTLCANVPAA